MEQNIIDHIKNCTQKVTHILHTAAEVIENIPKGSKLTQTELNKIVAQKHETTPDKVYHITRLLVQNYPGKVIKERGVDAGIYNI